MEIEDRFKIKLHVRTEQRLFEVMESMPSMEMSVMVSHRGIPQLVVVFWNKDGVVLYRYHHSGLIGLDSLHKKLTELEEKVKK